MVVQVSLLVGGATVKETSHQMNILNCSKRHQVLRSQVLIVHTGIGNSMDTHTMILRMSMGSHSTIVSTVVLRMGMGNTNMESLWYPCKCNNHH